jgi:diadenosine tetraphosphatase ApaH/serine/threonine PP2A family protein phosphatase
MAAPSTGQRVVAGHPPHPLAHSADTTSQPAPTRSTGNYPLTAVFSDVHSNRQALARALGDAAARGVRRYVCLGDVVGYGAAPLECLDRVMQVTGTGPDGRASDVLGREVERGLCLLGNHEQALLDSAEDFNPRARAAIEWTRSAIAAGGDAYWDFVGALVPSQCDAVAQFVHGSPRDPLKEYVMPSDVRHAEKYGALFVPMERPICFVGHSHVPAVYYDDQRYYRPRETEGPYRVLARPTERAIVNVGSVGQPRDGDVRLSYVLFDGENVTFVRLEYDVPGAQADIRGVSALPEYLAERLSQGR